MELLSCYSMVCYRVESSNGKLVEKSSKLGLLKLFLAKENRILRAGTNCKLNSLGFSDLRCSNYSKIQSVTEQELSGSFGSSEGFQNAVNTNTLSECYNSYAVYGKVNAKNVSERENSATRILIPGLPDESSGGCGSPISSCFWEWKPKLNVHFEKSGSGNVNSPPVLFLPGFGVGSFHYEKQLKDLGRDFRVWAVDFLGQGKSLPSEDPAPLCNEEGNSEEKDLVWGFGNKTEQWANNLVYSVDLWRDQIHDFIEQVIGEPVYIVGNSLGGFVALYFAACYPQLVKGVILLNATPFWGFLPNPIRSPRLARIFPWAGTFPLPANVRKLTELIWKRISDPRSIEEILKQVYADHSTKFDKVFSCIRETSQHPAAAASFASIMFAPRGQLSFQEALSRCRMNHVPICLVYGKDDPWVKPVWGLQVKQQLPEAPYYEISPAGHCPHDEVPEVVNYLLRGWISSLESDGSVALPLLDNPQSDLYGISRDLEFLREGLSKSVRVRFVRSEVSLWKQISSLIKPKVTNSETNSR